VAVGVRSLERGLGPALRGVDHGKRGVDRGSAEDIGGPRF